MSIIRDSLIGATVDTDIWSLVAWPRSDLQLPPCLTGHLAHDSIYENYVPGKSAHERWEWLLQNIQNLSQQDREKIEILLPRKSRTNLLLMLIFEKQTS